MFESIQHTNNVADILQILSKWIGAGPAPGFRASWRTAPIWARLVGGDCQSLDLRPLYVFNEICLAFLVMSVESHVNCESRTYYCSPSFIILFATPPCPIWSAESIVHDLNSTRRVAYEIFHYLNCTSKKLVEPR